MIRLNVNGGWLDLPQKIKLQFKRVNEVLAFDNLQVSRTTSFSLPATPTNLRLLNCPADVNTYGDTARRILDSVLSFNSLQVNGRLYFDKCTKDTFECIFLFGEYQMLQKLNESGDIALAADDTTACQKGDGSGDAWSSYATAAAQYDYFGFNYYGGEDGIVKKSVRLSALVEKTITAASINVELADDPQRLRVVCPESIGVEESGVLSIYNRRLDTEDGRRCTYSGTQGVFAQSTESVSCKWTPFSEKYDLLTDGAYTMQGYKALQSMSITFGDAEELKYVAAISYPAPSGPEGYYVEEGDHSIRGKTIHVEALQEIYFIEINQAHNSFLPNSVYDGEYLEGYVRDVYQEGYACGWFGPAAVSGIDQDAEDFHYGEFFGKKIPVEIKSDKEQPDDAVIFLKNNLPKLKYSEMLQAYAALTGTMLAYSSTKNTFYFTDYANYTVKQINDSDVLSVKSIKRTYSDFSQKNYVKFADDEESTSPVRAVYVVDNATLEAESDFCKIPLNCGNLRADGFQDAGGDDELLCLAWNGVNGAAASVQPTLQKINVLEQLCNGSTCCTVRIKMPAEVFFDLEASTVLGWHGAMWAWTDGVWSDGVAEFSVSKFK